MYKAFYKLREKPFSLLPDPEFLYFSEKHRMALVLLEYGLMSQVSFSVVTGGIGTGKTTLIRQLLNQIDNNIAVGLISNTHRSFGDLLQWILLAFNLDSSGKDNIDMYKTFVDFLIEEYAQRWRVVLIVDEAQNLSPETLEELRMLSNINADKDQVLQIILVGQAELRDTLSQPQLEQFAQRIAIDYHLEPLSRAEVGAYIRHRLEVAGGDPDLFDEEACIAVYQHSCGIPRLINLLCDLALVYGYAAQNRDISADLVNEVASEKRKGGLLLKSQAPIEDDESSDDVIPRIGNNKNIDSTEKLVTLTGTRKRGSRKKEVGGSDRRKKKLRIALASNSEEQRIRLKKVLEKCSMRVVASVPVSKKLLDELDQDQADVLLVDLDENFERDQDVIDSMLDYLMEECRLPVLFNDSSADHIHPADIPDEFGKNLSLKLTTLIEHGSAGSFLYFSGQKKAGAE